MIALFAIAHAQDLPFTEAPPLSADTFRPSVDAQRMFVSDEAARTVDFVGRADVHYMHNPLVWTPPKGERVDLLAEVVALNLAGAWGTGPLRLGVSAPVYIVANGDVGQGSALGDLAMDAKVTAPELSKAQGFGVAVLARVTLPMGASDRFLGYAVPTTELTAIADYEVGKALLVANIGARFLPTVEAVQVTAGDALSYKLGGGFEVAEGTHASVELAGQLTWTALSDPAGVPLEALVGANHRLDSGSVFRGGVGVGLLPGIGTPALRVVVGAGRAN